MRRLAKIALALAVLFVVGSGERWVLEHAATSASELAVATRMADLVVGEAGASHNPSVRRKAGNGGPGDQADED